MNESKNAARKSALLVIDVQKGLFQKNTPIYKADELLDNITALVKKAQAAEVPVFYIQHSDQRDLAFGSEGWQLHLGCIPWRKMALSSSKKATPSKIRTWMKY